jgi:hypothetical protein
LAGGWRGGKPANGYGGYLRITVPGQGTERVHRLIWEAAHGPIPPGFHVHHVNRNKTDNRLENLALISASEHSRLHSTTRKLTGADVRAIRERYAIGGISHAALGREYGVNKVTVTRILQRKMWRHVA